MSRPRNLAALEVLDHAVRDRHVADATWRSAIKRALATGIPIEEVATRARTTIDEVLAIMDEPWS